jgi:hypothetical protein
MSRMVAWAPKAGWAVCGALISWVSACTAVTGLDGLDEVQPTRDAAALDVVMSMDSSRDQAVYGDATELEATGPDARSDVIHETGGPMESSAPEGGMPLALAGPPLARTLQGTAGITFALGTVSGQSVGVFVKTAGAAATVTDTLMSSFVETMSLAASTSDAVHFFLATSVTGNDETITVNGSCSTCFLGAMVFVFDRSGVQVDGAGAAAYAERTPATTGSAVGSRPNDLYLGFIETETTAPVFGAFGDSPGSGTPTTTGVSSALVISGITYAVDAATQLVASPTTIGFQQVYSPSGYTAGGIVALSAD